MGKFKFALFYIIAILLVSCAPAKKSLVYNNAEAYFDRIKTRDNFVKSLSAVGSVTFDSPEFSNSANLKMNLKRPDTLTLKVETIFGINLGEVQVYSDSFKIVDRFHNRVMRGKISEYLQDYLGVDISSSELIDVLLACPKIESIKSQRFENGDFVVVEEKGNGEAILKFNSELELESYSFVKSGEKIFEVFYSRYSNFEGVTLPKSVKIYDGSGRGIYLSFSEIDVN